MPAPFPNYDRHERNRMDSMEFWGYDDREEGTTAWYTSSGILDSITATPRDDDEW